MGALFLDRREVPVPASDFALLSRWATHLTAEGCRPKTVRLYLYGVFRLLSEYVHGDLRATTEDQISTFLADMSDRATAKSQYAKGIRSCFRWLHRRGEITVDPSAGI